ncbi:MAG: PilZ domain-containing protein [Arenimonas sp.]
MKNTTPEGSDHDNRRRHVRSIVASVILVTPNGHENRTHVYDLSESGAKIGLPGNFDFGIGAGVRLFFPLPRGPTLALGARIVRVAIDHLGIEFGEGQEAELAQLMAALTPD